MSGHCIRDEVPLGDLLSAVIDYRGKTPEKSTSGVRLVTAKVIKQGRILDQPAEFVSEASYSTWMRRGLPKRGDILVTTEAPLGEVAQLVDEQVALAQRVILLRPDPVKVHPPFVFHYLRSDHGRARLRERASGTTVSGIRQPELLAVRIPLLSRSEQARTSAILDTLDVLIGINERRIELLEGLARSLYRDWFVRRQAGSGATVAIADVAEPVKGTAAPSKEPNAVFEHFSIPAFDAGRLPRYEVGNSIKSSKTKLAGECVLLSKLNPRIPRAWFVVPETDNAVASTELLAWRGRRVSNAWLWAAFSDDAFQRRLTGSAGGTSTSHQRVKPADVAGYPVPQPTPDALEAFDSLAEPALRGAALLRRSNRALARTRDLLLPRLVTGRLDISDVDLGDLLPDENAA